jgi:hypothetical protein
VLAQEASRIGDTDLQCRVREERRVRVRARQPQRRVDVVRGQAVRGAVLALVGDSVANKCLTLTSF